MDSHHVVALPCNVNEQIINHIMETFRSHNENSQVKFISGAINHICLHGPDDALRTFVEHVHMLLELEAEHELNEDVRPEGNTPTRFPEKSRILQPEQIHLGHNNLVQLWTPAQPSKKPFQLRHEILQHISSLTCCSIRWDEQSNGYEIGGAMELNIELAKSRLQNTLALEEFSTNRSSNYLCNESKETIQIKLIPWKDFLQTKLRDVTIFDSRLQNLDSMLVAVSTNSQGVQQIKTPSRRLLSPIGIWGLSPRPFLKPRSSRTQNEKGLVEEWLDDTVQQSAATADVRAKTSPMETMRGARVPLVMSVDASMSFDMPIPRGSVAKPPKIGTAQSKPKFQQGEIGETNQARYIQTFTLGAQDTPIGALHVRAQGSPLPNVDLKFNDNNVAANSASLPASKADREEPLIDLYAFNSSPAIGLIRDGRGNRDHPSAKQEPRTMEATVPQTTEKVKGFRELLEHARLHPGLIKIQMRLGKLLIRPEYVMKRFRGRQLRETEWNSMIRDQHHSCVFSERLTTKDVEAESILGIKLSGGRQLFTENPRERRISYELSCETATCEQVIVEISGKGYPKLRGQDLTIGSTNLHFGKRFWDAQVAVMASDVVVGNYEVEIDRIATTFKVTGLPDGNATVHWNTQTSAFEVKRVTMRQETMHASSLFDGIELRLTKLRRLGCNASSIDSTAYDVLVDERTGELAPQSVWWTASISSLEADSVLEENKSLEIGEISAWSTEDIAGHGVIEKFLAMADVIVPRIDHIGAI